MSLAVATLSRDCIVVGADRRTTISSQVGTRYSDETTKIFPMDSRAVIAYTGDNYVAPGFSVERFLTSFKQKYFNQPLRSIFELPALLLEEIRSLNTHADIEFIVAGYIENTYNHVAYFICTKNNTIEQVTSPGNYLACFLGQTHIASAILGGNSKYKISYPSLSIKEAIELTRLAITATSKAFQFYDGQVVGGATDLYIVYADAHRSSHWLTQNHLELAIPESCDSDGVQ